MNTARKAISAGLLACSLKQKKYIASFLTLTHRSEV